MEITSQGLKSEFIFHKFSGEIKNHGDCISVLTPLNQSYFYGNMIVYPSPPQVGDMTDWVARFDRIFANYPEVRHSCFQWLPTNRADEEALVEFKAAGFTIDETSVLSATLVHTNRPAPEGVDFRQIQSDAEWLAVVDAQTKYGFPSIPMVEYRKFKEDAYANYRRMAEQGMGAWWGAFKGDELVADLGLFFDDKVGRFQSVETALNHRRQGICTALVHHVSQWGFDAHPGATLILHAEVGEVAREIYRGLGYEETEVLQSVFKAP